MKLSNGSSILILGVLGIASALLSIALPSGGYNSILWVGTVYGLALSVYFVCCRGVRVFDHLLALVLASVGAYTIAFVGPFPIFAMQVVLASSSASHQGEVPLLYVFDGGVLGGIALLSAVLLLFVSRPLGKGELFTKLALGSLLSGLVGVGGWSLGSSLGQRVWLMLPWTLLHTGLAQPDTPHYISLYLVWQPIMALAIGAVTSEGPSILSLAAAPKPD